MQVIGDITPTVWPTAKAMADDIDEPYEKVRKWLQRGRIPDYAWPVVIRKSNGSLTAEKLLKLNQPRKPRGA